MGERESQPGIGSFLVNLAEKKQDEKDICFGDHLLERQSRNGVCISSPPVPARNLICFWCKWEMADFSGGGEGSAGPSQRLVLVGGLTGVPGYGVRLNGACFNLIPFFKHVWVTAVMYPWLLGTSTCFLLALHLKMCCTVFGLRGDFDHAWGSTLELKVERLFSKWWCVNEGVERKGKEDFSCLLLVCLVNRQMRSSSTGTIPLLMLVYHAYVAPGGVCGIPFPPFKICSPSHNASYLWVWVSGLVLPPPYLSLCHHPTFFLLARGGFQSKK